MTKNRIFIDAKNVTILKTPEEFYLNLLKLAEKSKSRITLSSLYIGTSEKSKRLLTLLRKRQEEFRVPITLLCEGTRSKRPISLTNQSLGNNLSIEETYDVNSSLDFVIDNLGNESIRSGLTKIHLHFGPVNELFSAGGQQLLPNRFNEIFNLHHIKAYVFDSTVIITGANLSEDYFTNRQDRAWVIEDENVAEYFHQLISFFAEKSVAVQLNEKDPLVELKPPQRNLETFEEFKERFANYLNSNQMKSDTFIEPTVQAKHYAINDESKHVEGLLDLADSQEFEITLATAYFCLDNHFQDVILKLIKRPECKTFTLVTSSMKANGFTGSKGPSGYIPYLYNMYLSDFARLLNRLDNKYVKRNIFEWADLERTFHAKGLWINMKSCYLTQIGSSNYNYRSFNRDVECQLTLVTKNKDLMGRLETERNHILDPKCTSLHTENRWNKDQYLLYWLLRGVKPILKYYF